MKNRPLIPVSNKPSHSPTPIARLRLVDDASFSDEARPVYQEISASEDVSLVRTEPESSTATLDEILIGVRRLANVAAHPRTVWIGSLGSSKFRLRAQIPVEIATDDDGSAIARSLDLEVHATGESELDALAHLRQAISEDFRTLLDERDNLGPHLSDLLKRYHDLIDVIE